jgi:hypothetical protein
MKSSRYEDQIFINCPFDPDYFPILRAILFTVYRCGFLPNTALNFDNGLQNRLQKIKDCIQGSKYGIHDISRIESKHGLPRFNMPFELGLFFGAQCYGNKRQRDKNAIIFDRIPFRYQKFISDLNGVDVKAHKNNISKITKQIRDWLKIASNRTNLPGETLLLKEYKAFARKIPKICDNLGYTQENIPFNDFCLMVEKGVKRLIGNSNPEVLANSPN